MKLIGFTFNSKHYFIGKNYKGWLISDQEDARRSDRVLVVDGSLYGLSDAIKKFQDFKDAHSGQDQTLQLLRS